MGKSYTLPWTNIDAAIKNDSGKLFADLPYMALSTNSQNIIILSSAVILIIISIWCFGQKLDYLFLQRLSLLQTPPLTIEQQELDLLRHLIGSLRSGHSLQESLEEFSKNAKPKGPLELSQEGIQLLSGEKSKISFAGIVHNSLVTGESCLQSLYFFRRQIESRLKNNRKLLAVTTQARAQAWICGFIPWGMFLIFSLMEWDLVSAALKNMYCWIIWVFALAMDIGGLYWIKKSIHNAFTANPQQKALEQELPDLILNIHSAIAMGKDIESAFNEAKFILKENSKLKDWLFDSQSKDSTLSDSYKVIPSEIKQLQSILQRAIHYGSPLQAELQLLLDEVEYQKENRREECLQKAPLKLLSPLFLCIFPAALLVLVSILLPILGEF